MVQIAKVYRKTWLILILYTRHTVRPSPLRSTFLNIQKSEIASLVAIEKAPTQAFDAFLLADTAILDTLATEYSRAGQSSVLHRIRWYRVVLDEGEFS